MDAEDDFVHVFLEFNEKLAPSIFANKMFLRVANLHKPHPLVQINDLVFKGTYDECVGTNLFFEEIEDPPLKTNIFEKETPIRLKPVITQTKLIKLKQMKLPKKVTTNKQSKESVVLNLNQDYKAILEKLDQGILNIEDIAKSEADQPVVDHFDDEQYEIPEDVSTEPEKELETLAGLKNTRGAILEAKYEKLKRLVRRPVKRMKSPELIEECDAKYSHAYEYHNLERRVCQSSDAFRTLSGIVIDKNFIGGVDTERCLLHGLVAPSGDFARDLTKQECNKIFTIDNFENLSIPARYLVLKDCVKKIEELIEATSSDELKETDDSGRTIRDICDVFRRLVRALEDTMASKLEGEITVKCQIPPLNRSPDEFIKYKYQSSQDLILDSKEIWNEDEWTDCEDSNKDGATRRKVWDMDDESDSSVGS